MAGFDNDIMYATNVDFSSGNPVTGKVTTDGQLLIGSTAAPNIRVGSLTSSGGTVTITTGAGTINLESVPVAKAQVVAYLNTGLTNVTGDSTGVFIIFDTVVSNIGSAYNNATGVFTAPRTGNYLVSATVMFNNLLATHTEGELTINPTTGNPLQINIFNPGLNETQVTGYTKINSQTVTGIVSIAAASQFRIRVNVYNGTKTVGIQGATFALETALSITEL